MHKENFISDFVYYGTAITQAKGHEPTLYKTLQVIVGIFLTLTFVKMKGPKMKRPN